MLFLIFEIVVLLALVYQVTACDYLSPGAFFCISWLSACTCALVTMNYWHIDYSMHTVIMMGVSIAVYITSCCLTRMYYQKKIIKFHKTLHKSMGITPITIPVIRVVLLSLFSLLFLLYLIKDLKQITGTSNLMSISSIYRISFLNGEATLPFMSRQIYRFFKMQCFLYVYILVRNVYKKQYIKKTFILFIPIIIFSAACIVQGNRSDLMYIFFSTIFFIYIFYVKDHGLLKRIALKKMIISLFVVILLLFAFSQMRFIAGRTSQASPIMYIAGYMSSGLAGFNEYIKNDINHINNSTFGGMTFYGIWRCVSQYIMGAPYMISRPFTFINGISLGNTYTALYNYYYDFGFTGMLFIVVIVAFLFEKYYIKIMSNKNDNVIQNIMYSYFLIGLLLFAYDEHIFSDKLNFGLITDFLCLILNVSIISVKNKKGKLYIKKVVHISRR